MGLSIGLGISMHYQALNLLLYSVAIFFLSRAKIKELNQKKFFQIFFGVLSLGFGLLLPSLPLLYWDYGQGWANLKNILDYFLIGQYRIWVSNRWLTYLTVFWPNFWSRIIGGNSFIGFSLMILLGWFGIYQLLKKKLKKEIFWLGVIFAIQIILNRYYRGERFEGYVLYFQPLVLLFSAWAVVSLIKLNKILGFLFLLTITFFTLKQDIKEIKLQDNQVDKVWQIVDILKTRYPDKKFSFYDCYYLEPFLSQMLSLFLDFQGLNDEKNGVLLGVSQGPIKHPQPIYHFKLNKDFYIYELNQQLISNKEKWINVNSDYVYQDILWWWKNKPLKSTFSLTNYLKERLRL